MSVAMSLAAMLMCSRKDECAETWPGWMMALTNTQGPPRPDADNHWHLMMQRSLMTQEEFNDYKIVFS